MTDVLEERLRSAADNAMTGVELAPPASDDAVAPPRRHRRWLTAAAGIAAAVVLWVPFVVAGRGTLLWTRLRPTTIAAWIAVVVTAIGIRLTTG